MGRQLSKWLRQNFLLAALVRTASRDIAEAVDESVVFVVVVLDDSYAAFDDGVDVVVSVLVAAEARLVRPAVGPVAAVAARIEVRAVVRPRTRGDWSSRN